ncbi:MAG: hypothetical protein KW788_02470 [Candidatus Doudnabacteria bacterium]|nr:hypothetical protein [Candidatus Doudnabacteria bacterium]
MGGGHWDDDAYTSSSSSRRSAGVDDFAYSKSARSVHASLDPKRISGKPFGKLESRDSLEHPDSNAIIVAFDVTGSNISRAVEAQKALPALMNLLPKYIPDPQIAVAANDDIKAAIGRSGPVQISEFESDNRIDEHIRNIWLVGDGGGNNGESYDLILYAAARKTVMDCFEKRGRKGYLFLYADEPFMNEVDKREVADVFGDSIKKDIPVTDMIAEVREAFHVFVLWPVGGYDDAYQQFLELFGKESVLILQHPNKICELIGVTIGVNEQKISAAQAVDDLVAVGVSKKMAHDISESLVPLSKNKAVAKATGGLPRTSRGGAARL